MKSGHVTFVQPAGTNSEGRSSSGPVCHAVSATRRRRPASFLGHVYTVQVHVYTAHKCVHMAICIFPMQCPPVRLLIQFKVKRKGRRRREERVRAKWRGGEEKRGGKEREEKEKWQKVTKSIL